MTLNSKSREFHRDAAWNRWVHLAGAITFMFAVVLFIALADDAPEGDYLTIENKIMQAMRHDGQPIGPPGTAVAVRDITALGSVVVISVMTCLILGYIWMRGQYRAAALIAFATAGGQGLNLVLKDAFVRERPAAAWHLVEVRSTSFPSGHAMGASIFYLTLGASLTRVAKRRREKVYILGSALLLTFLIGLSRVYLGVHYPTDVLAGWSAGTAWALLCWFVAGWLERRAALRFEMGTPPGA